MKIWLLEDFKRDFIRNDELCSSLFHTDERITEQRWPNCIYDNACLIRDSIKREARTVIFVASNTLLAVRPDSRISCGLSCILTSLTLSHDNTGDNCRISHNETRSRASPAFTGRTPERTEWNRKSLFQYQSGLQDRAESIKIRKDTVYDRCVSLVCDGDAT